MSFSIPSACRPEMIRRPSISAALTIPTIEIATTSQASTVVPRPASIPSIASPTSRTIAIAAACESTARIVDTSSDQRYGLRKPSRRTNVRRYGTSLTVGI